MLRPLHVFGVDASILDSGFSNLTVYFVFGTIKHKNTAKDLPVAIGVQQTRGRPMNQRIQIDIPRTEIADFCKRHHITKLAFFGSVLREDFHRQSDIDVLVEFETNRVPGLIRLAGMEIELSETLGQKVDLRTPEDLSRYFRQEVVESAEVIYAKE